MLQDFYHLFRILANMTFILILQWLKKEEHKGGGWGHLRVLLPQLAKSTQHTFIKVLKRVGSYQKKINC